ncbi:MAG: beta-3-deoxy-D-manno-oct-2-ulosonic acid transferase [Proteobacteria bacterium]|nr:beta-3-deoxy-D-manno-oct-2-ulosonic acid transferase [Pseudomonadota bacterium]
MDRPSSPPFLRIPPFPGQRAGALTAPGTSTVDPQELADALRRERVGGSFWGGRPHLPSGALVLAPGDARQLATMRREAGDGRVMIVAAKDTDPWHLAECAAEIWADADHDLAIIAVLLGKPLRLFTGGQSSVPVIDPDRCAADAVTRVRYANPFDGQDWSALQAIAQLGEWRRLIDANREIDAVFGIAAWKRVTLDAMLWDGSGPVRYARRPMPGTGPGSRVAIWKSRTAPSVLEQIEASGAALGEVEDGFVRSSGLGANCVPPLSAIVDFSGIYFDPAGPSDLETILEHSNIGSALCQRASTLRARLVQAAISKYGRDDAPVIRPQGGKRRILVTGQVEDDRSILSGGAGTSNLELLERARVIEGDAWIIYKPHPDVEAGHRRGHVDEADALRLADEVLHDASITSLIESVDGVHVITSLAGFEALLRGKSVTTHGVPFYAGWGLTRDLGPVPARRTRRRSLDELVAATLLMYPRYLDPVTRLPCPAEVLVERMAAGQAAVRSPLVTLREMQGRAAVWWRRLGGERR